MIQPDQETEHTLLERGARLKAGARSATLSRIRRRDERELPRRLQDSPSRLKVESDGPAFQAAMRSTAVKVSRTRISWRLVRLLSLSTYFMLGVLLHRLTRKSPVERQKLNAERLRRLLVRLGGVMIKVGQQMSQRADILPPAYCDELKNLLDEIPTGIDKVDVVAAIERRTGRPLQETFADFDFDPIGSASVACVYQAVLHSGDEVAVKIRRPRIQKEFTSDLSALEWMLKFAEFLTFWRPGMSDNLRFELRDSLLEELDFRIEARYQELFRRYHKRRKKLKVTAPKVFFQLSGEEVLVSEFVTGWWVKDIISARHRGDEEYLGGLRSAGIELRIVAKHLIRSSHYQFHECPLFHGDPHAANILVQPNNRIVLVDFGACGVFAQRDRNIMWQLNHYYSREDVGGMVNMVISIMEPLPNVYIEPFKKELLDAWWKGFYGIKSKHAEWWERTSFRLWLRFFELMRKHQIPVPRNLLRMIRATLLYDTVAAELYSKINVFKEFEKYSNDVARRARREITEGAIRQLLLGPDDSAFLKLRQIANVGNGVLFRVQKLLDEPIFSFAAIISKVFSAIRAFVRMLLLAGAWTVAAVVVLVMFHKDGLKVITQPGVHLWSWHLEQDWSKFVIINPSEWSLRPIGYWKGFLPVYSVGFLQVIALVWFLIVSVSLFAYARRVYLKFGDPDHQRTRGTW